MNRLPRTLPLLLALLLLLTAVSTAFARSTTPTPLAPAELHAVFGSGGGGGGGRDDDEDDENDEPRIVRYENVALRTDTVRRWTETDYSRATVTVTFRFGTTARISKYGASIEVRGSLGSTVTVHVCRDYVDYWRDLRTTYQKYAIYSDGSRRAVGGTWTEVGPDKYTRKYEGSLYFCR